MAYRIESDNLVYVEADIEFITPSTVTSVGLPSSTGATSCLTQHLSDSTGE